MSDITTAIDRLRRDIEQIENHQATELRERSHQVGRIVTAFQGILEEFNTAVTHLQKELETVCETAKVKQLQLFTSMLDMQASFEYAAQRLSTLAQDLPDANPQPALEPFRDPSSMVIEGGEFSENGAKRRPKLTQLAGGAQG